MEKLEFKTNINCDACVAKVTPVLNANQTIESWEVDTKNPAKVLTLAGSDIDIEAVISALAKIGYRAEQI
jgi:copper chaperone